MEACQIHTNPASSSQLTITHISIPHCGLHTSGSADFFASFANFGCSGFLRTISCFDIEIFRNSHLERQILKAFTKTENNLVIDLFFTLELLENILKISSKYLFKPMDSNKRFRNRAKATHFCHFLGLKGCIYSNLIIINALAV